MGQPKRPPAIVAVARVSLPCDPDQERLPRPDPLRLVKRCGTFAAISFDHLEHLGTPVLDEYRVGGEIRHMVGQRVERRAENGRQTQ